MHPKSINTKKENLFLFELPTSILYFKQEDIVEFINNANNRKLLGKIENYKSLLDTLKKKIKTIRIPNPPNFPDGPKQDSVMKVYRDSVELRNISSLFYVIGAALMLNGDFMLYSIESKKFLTRKLYAIRNPDIPGQKSLDFYLPDKKRYYWVITEVERKGEFIRLD